MARSLSSSLAAGIALLSCGSMVFGCLDSLRRVGTYPVKEEGTDADEAGEDGAGVEGKGDEPADTLIGPDGGLTDEAEREEDKMEDDEALSALIASKLRGEDLEGRSSAPPPGDGYDPGMSLVPPANESMKLSGPACLRRLKAAGVQFERPGFETPLVPTPVLLTAPIQDVWVRARWQSERPVKSVMDCHLALALVEVARQASALGIVEINFYSIYRPLKAPPKKCPKGRGKRKCMKKKKKYEQARRSGSGSQHRFARAIDIGWLKTEAGEIVDVLEHFDRRPKRAPCGYTPATKKGSILADFVCGLHRNGVFNVMLTPNANRAHHNHFHFDLTPNANWYILR